MRLGLGLASALIGVMAMAGAAQAQVVNLVCSGTGGETFIRQNGQLMVQPAETAPQLEVRLDFDSGMFQLGTTSGQLAATDSSVFAVAAEDPYYALYEIDRRTGSLRGTGKAADGDMVIFMRMFASCTTTSGSRSF